VLRYRPDVTRVSHSFTCHPQKNHTCLHSPAATRHRPLAGTHCAYPQRDGHWPGWVDLIGWLYQRWIPMLQLWGR